MEVRELLPSWFRGVVFAQGGTVKNRVSGVKVDLDRLELTMYNYLLDKEREMETDPRRELYYNRAINWFESRNENLFTNLIQEKSW